MNTHASYERHLDRRLPDAAAGAEDSSTSGQEASAFAVHRDPSAPQPTDKDATPRPRSGVAWVRPTHMPNVLGAPVVGRGIDLQAELTRRARRTPARGAGRVRHRVTRTAIARAQDTPPTVTAEEPRL